MRTARPFPVLLTMQDAVDAWRSGRSVGGDRVERAAPGWHSRAHPVARRAPP